jgi:hypothetical protein
MRENSPYFTLFARHSLTESAINDPPSFYGILFHIVHFSGIVLSSIKNIKFFINIDVIYTYTNTNLKMYNRLTLPPPRILVKNSINGRFAGGARGMMGERDGQCLLADCFSRVFLFHIVHFQVCISISINNININKKFNVSTGLEFLGLI